MDDKRQKTQVELALATESAGEAPKLRREGTESPTAKHETESLAEGQLMEQVCERENLKRALARVKRNDGSAGVDGMSVSELSGYLKMHWPEVRERLLAGQYQPLPVRRVEIDKPGGKDKRKLGIPTVSVNCTFGQHPFGLGRDLPSLSPTERSALPRTEGATGRWRRHGYSAQYRARQLRCSQAMD